MVPVGEAHDNLAITRFATRPLLNSLQPSEVLVEVSAAGVCHSDLHLVHARSLPYALPLTLGHELAGRIVPAYPGRLPTVLPPA